MIGVNIYPENVAVDKNQFWTDDRIRLKSFRECNKAEMAYEASEFISLKPSISEILFYYSLLPIVSMFLGTLNVFPDVVLVMTGPMGHFKTTMARIATCILEQEYLQELKFYQAPRPEMLEERIRMVEGMNLLIDDIFPATGQYSKARQADLLNIISRYGDKRGYKAGIIITAEHMPEKLILSGRDRIFQLDIPFMDSEEKTRLYNKSRCIRSSLMAQVSENFVKSLMDNFDEVIKDITEFIQNYQPLEGLNADTRIGNHAEYLLLSEFLYRKYICDGNEEWSMRKQFEKVLGISAVKQHKAICRMVSGKETDYTQAVYNMLTGGNKYLRMENNRDNYMPDGKNFLILDGKYYVTRTALQFGMIRYMERTVSMRKVSDALWDAGVLEVDNGGARTRKGFSNVRHYVISRQAIEMYCGAAERV